MPPKMLFPVLESDKKSYEEFLRNPLVVALRRRGAEVEARDYTDVTCDLSAYTHIVFLLMWEYHLDLDKIQHFMVERLKGSEQCIFANPPAVILWNMDKSVYLPDLQAAGFRVPQTVYLPLPTGRDAVGEALQRRSMQRPVVLKPSVSASSYLTTLIQDPENLDNANEDVLTKYDDLSGPGRLMIQEFIPEVQTAGEISVVMIDGKIAYGIRKVPPANEFRSQSKFGGAQSFVSAKDLHTAASSAANGLWKYVADRFAGAINEKHRLLYARIDGVINSDGDFVLMEAEFFEPALWFQLEEAWPALQRFCDLILQT